MIPHHIDAVLLLDHAASPVSGKNLAKGKREDLRNVCQEFEAIFVRALFKAMRTTIPEGGLLEKNIDTEIFQELMDIEIAKQTAKKQELGLADNLFRQLYQLETS